MASQMGGFLTLFCLCQMIFVTQTKTGTMVKRVPEKRMVGVRGHSIIMYSQNDQNLTFPLPLVQTCSILAIPTSANVQNFTSSPSPPPPLPTPDQNNR